jgi:K+ transporter
MKKPARVLASFFLTRVRLVTGDRPQMARWRSLLLFFLFNNQVDATSFFGILPDRPIEVGVSFPL